MTRLSIKNILDIKRASALLFLLFNIVWAARWRTRLAEFLFLSMLHNFGLQILCNLPSCNYPESMVLYICQEGKAKKSRGRELLESKGSKFILCRKSSERLWNRLFHRPVACNKSQRNFLFLLTPSLKCAIIIPSREERT